MSYFKIIFYIGLFIIAMSCKKKKYETIAQGRILQSPSGKPIVGAKVTLQDGVGNSGPINLGNTSSNARAESYTNANGEFNLQIEGEFTPYISTGADKYHDFKYEGVGVMPLKYGINNNIILYLSPESFFGSYFVSKDKTLEVSELIVTLLSHRDITTPIIDKFRSKDNLTLTFTSSFDGSGYPIYGDRYQRFKIEVKHDNLWERKIDSVFVPAFANFKDTIYY